LVFSNGNYAIQDGRQFILIEMVSNIGR
jgi:hypothetical protein